MILFFVVYKTKVIKMRNAMWVGGGITGMGEIPMLGVKEKGIAKVIRDVFRGGEQGFFYDPSDLKAEYQDAAGTTSVNATGQPLGLVLDKSKELMLGPNKAKAVSINGVPVGGDVVTNYVVADSLVVGRMYKVSIKISGYTGSDTAGLAAGGSDAFVNVPGNLRLKAESTTISFFAIASSTSQRLATRSTNTATFEEIQIREVLGNHAYQTTSAARPIFRQKPILGSELVVNGDFETSTTSWAAILATAVVENAKCKLTVNNTGGRIGQSIPTVAGKTYQISWEAQSIVSVPMIRVGTASGSGDLLSVNAASGKRSAFFTAGGASTTISLTTVASGGQAYFDSVSVKEVTGYRTDQNYIEYDGVDDKLITNLPSVLTNCTVLRAIPNVGTQVKYSQTLPMLYEDSTNHAGLVAIDRALTRQEQLRLMTELDKKAGATSLETLTFKTFDNNQEGFVFDPNDLSTLFQDAAGAVPVTGAGQPVGLVLDKSKGAALGLELSNYSAGFSSLAGISPVGATLSLEGNALVITAQVGTSRRAEIPISGLTVGKFYKIKFIARKNEIGIQQNFQQFTAFAKFSYQAVVTSTTASEYTFILEATSVSGVLRAYASSAEAIGAQMIVESVSVKEVSGNHAYQTTSASRPILRRNAVTGANYLEFDGTDDSLQTANINFTATDKVSLFAGVRKLSDAYSALCVELGDGSSSNLRAFALFAPAASGTAKYDLRNMVSSTGAITQDMKFNAPHSAVLTGTVTPNKVDKVSLRVNGEAALTSERGIGGNLIAAPLYIGRRGGTSLPFTGHIYGLIGIGKLVSASETAAIEKELAKRVGVTLNV